MAAIVRWQKKLASRRLAVSMAVGAAFLLGLAASEYSHSAESPAALVLIAALAVLVAGLVPIGARQLNSARFRLSFLNGSATRIPTGEVDRRNRQRREPIPFML